MSGSGYFLDCNTLSAYFSGNDNVVQRARLVPAECFGHISVITLGEIHFGHSFTQTTNQARRDDFERFIAENFPWPTPLDEDACSFYGDIRAELYRLYGPKEQNDSLNHVEQLCDVTGHSLGIDENDLWLVAHAIARGYVLVSNDRMKKIKSAAANVGHSLRLENWFESIK